MKNLGPLIILLAAFLFVGAVLAMVSVATTEYQHVTYRDTVPTDPEKIEESRDQLHSTFNLGIVLGVAAVLILVIGLGTVGITRLQNKTGSPSIAGRPEERGHNSDENQGERIEATHRA